jgi:hypothetical protein
MASFPILLYLATLIVFYAESQFWNGGVVLYKRNVSSYRVGEVKRGRDVCFDLDCPGLEIVVGKPDGRHAVLTLD